MKPFGFPFADSCVRHDFGYRNDTASGTFGGGKARIESAFGAGLERGCAVYAGAEKTCCDATACTCYRAVVKPGCTTPVDPA
ncbi:phospholipase A2 [Streptomyces sp. NPDC005134]